MSVKRRMLGLTAALTALCAVAVCYIEGAANELRSSFARFAPDQGSSTNVITGVTDSVEPSPNVNCIRSSGDSPRRSVTAAKDESDIEIGSLGVLQGGTINQDGAFHVVGARQLCLR